MEETARWTRGRILGDQRYDEQDRRDGSEAGAEDLYSKDLIEVVFRQPNSKIKFLEEAGIGNRQTASVYLKELEKIGVLRAVKKGREIYYLNGKFLDTIVK